MPNFPEILLLSAVVTVAIALAFYIGINALDVLDRKDIDNTLDK